MLRKVAKQFALLSAYHAFAGSTLKYGILYWGNTSGRGKAFKSQRNVFVPYVEYMKQSRANDKIFKK